MIKFIEVHPTDFPDRRIYINPANIMAVGEYEQNALIFIIQSELRSSVLRIMILLKMKIIKTMED